MQLAGGKFTRIGVSWFLSLVLADPPQDATELQALLDESESHSDELLESEWMATQIEELAAEGLDGKALNEAVAERLVRAWDRPEKWAAHLKKAIAAVREALAENGNPSQLAVKSIELAQLRAMLALSEQFEAVIWRGYQTRGIEAMQAGLEVWETHRNEASEDFWHKELLGNELLLQQLVGAPAVVVDDKVYVGGRQIGAASGSGNVLDLLLKGELSGNVVLVELKTPETQLVSKTAYRTGVHSPSRELTGATVQVLTYRDSLLKEWRELSAGDASLRAYEPHCLVLAGDLEDLDGKEPQQRSFELYRSAVRPVEILTYDELFERARAFLKLLTQAQSEQSVPPSAENSKRADRSN